MKNKEKFKDEIIDFIVNHDYIKGMAISKKDNKLYRCGDMFCSDCLFAYNDKKCDQLRKEWLDEQYKEHIVIGDAEYDILSQINGYKYIARDGDGDLYLYKRKPNKNKRRGYWYDDERALKLYCFNYLFKCIKWEDEESYAIDELIQEYYKNSKN